MNDRNAPPPNRDFWKSRRLTILLLGADILGFAASWWLAYELRAWLGTVWLGPLNVFTPYATVFPIVVGAGVANAVVFGLYLHRRRISSLTRWGSLLKAGYHYLLYLMVIGYFFKELDLGRSVIFLCGMFAFGYLWLSRSMLRSLKERALERGAGRVRTAVVGTSAQAAEVYATIQRNRDIGYEVAGYVSHGGDPVEPAFAELPCIGDTANLTAVLQREGIEEVFLAVPHLTPDDQLNLLNVAELPGLRIHLVSELFDVLTRDTNVDTIAQLPVVTLRDGYLPWHQAMAKRALDLLASGIGVLLWLVFFHWWIALRIKSDSPGPIFFSQERVGRGGKLFRILKYRTMHTNAAAYAVAPTEEDDPRITRFGRWLRKTSLDELPQLLNVLRGDMSIVGPRPEMPFIVEKYEAWQRRRLDVKPGVTGLWQVIGRKNLPLHLNMEYDFYYIRNQSLLLDLEIMIRTVPAVIKGRGAY